LYLIDVFVVESTFHVPFVTHYGMTWLVSLTHHTSIILVFHVCSTTRINLVINQQLLATNVQPWSCHMYTFPLPNIYDISTCLQLICNYISIYNLKFKDLKFGQETFKQVTHGSISTYIPQCINDLHVMFMGFCFCS